MNVRCERCDKQYRIDESRYAGKAKVRVKCPSCQTILEVALGEAPASPPVPPAEGEAVRAAPENTTQAVREAEYLSAGGKVRAGALGLPEGSRVSIAILSGPDQGTIVPVDRPRLVIGRTEADLVLADPEASRQHAVLEVYGDKFLVRDLNSTNGTFIGDRKITAEELENHSEFRIGGSRMMLIITKPEE